MSGMKMLKKRGGKKSLRKMRGGETNTVTLKWDKEDTEEFKTAKVVKGTGIFKDETDVYFSSDVDDIYKTNVKGERDNEYTVDLGDDDLDSTKIDLKLSKSEFNKLPLIYRDENNVPGPAQETLTFEYEEPEEDEDDDDDEDEDDDELPPPPAYDENSAPPGMMMLQPDGLAPPEGGRKGKKRSSKKRSSKKRSSKKPVSKKRTGGKRKSQKSKKSKKSRKSRKSRKSKK